LASGGDVTTDGLIVPIDERVPEPRRTLHGISDIRAFFHTNTVPLYFIRLPRSTCSVSIVGYEISSI
jgi:hypothetical protein